MFVNIMYFPPIKAGKDAAFLEWFTWSTEQYAKHTGFVKRRLLKPRKEGSYVVLFEHESFETFMAMHTSPTQREAHRRLEPLLDGAPKPQFFDVVA